jgi:hypothetical protein
MSIFGGKNGIFLKHQYYDQMFAKTSSSLSEKRHFLAKRFFKSQHRSLGPML